MSIKYLTTNLILYCDKWHETVAFYEQTFEFSKIELSDWLVEFIISDNARISVADQNRTSIKSVKDKGIMLSWQVENIEDTWQDLKQKDINLEPIKEHPWGARLFRFYDPDGHPIEIWSSAD